MSKPHIPKPPYPAQVREQMIELCAGRTASELTKEFGSHVNSIHNYLRQTANKARGITPAQTDTLSASESQEILTLRR